VAKQRAASLTAAPSRRLSADERRAQLIAAALALFAERGFNATTMDDIAERAGVTKPLLYQHFESKRALYLELVDQVADELIAAIHEATAAANGPREQVEAGFRACLELMATRKDAFRLLFTSDEPGDPQLATSLRRVEDVVAREVEALIDAGLDDYHRRVLAYAVVGMVAAASRHWLERRRSREGRDRPSAADAHDAERFAEARQLARRLADLAWAGLRSVHRD
jgi:AcrR family transcriptional regulator